MRSLLSKLLFFIVLIAALPSAAGNTKNSSISEDEVRSRIKNMPLFFPAKYDKVVASYLRTYFERNRTKAEQIIGNTALYFPIFEKYIREQNMPMDLRMLPILESALNPHATSRSNAVGLWQFIQPTADGYGLANNSFVDERKDPHRSTQAALRFLGKLHERYGDWALALAAYNGGPTRVNNAIKRAKSRDFWKVKKYLPKETQNYIPAFVAATYLYNYFEYHDIAPTSHAVGIQMHDHLKVFDEISFQEISEVTGVPNYDIEFLNPSYKKRIIPKSYSGNYLVLPAWACQLMKNHLPQLQTVSGPIIDPDFLRQPNYMRTNYTVRDGDDIFKVASIFNCHPFNIKYWNNLKTDQIYVGQDLNVYMVTYRKRQNLTSTPVSLPQKKEREPVQIAPLLTIKSNPIDLYANSEFTSKGAKVTYEIYTLQSGESLLDIVEKFGRFSLAELLALNNLSYDAHLLPGSNIKLPQ